MFPFFCFINVLEAVGIDYLVLEVEQWDGRKKMLETIFGLHRIELSSSDSESERHDIKLIILSWIQWTSVGPIRRSSAKDAKQKEELWAIN